MDNNFSIKRLLVIIIMLTIVVAGGTFAWFTYQSKESALVLTIGDIDDTQIVLKPYQVTGTMEPVTTYTSGVYSTVEVSNNGESSSSINLFYKINELDEELIDNGLKYTIVSSATENGTYTEVKTGNFTAFKGQSEALIYETEVKDKIYYKVYLWVDNSVGDQSAIQGSTLNVELNGSILQDATAPEIVEGMIPVTISNTGAVTTIAATDENWYDYGHKKWANIVLVDADSRSTYEGTTGVTVTQSDILAYYVWIPRYKYKLWTTDASETTNPQTINIIFEDKDDPILLEKTKSLYRTHPAFWWDGNNDGKVDEEEKLAGIWVGKFETTGDATTPTILPNTTSLRTQNVSTQFVTGLKFSNGSYNNSTGAVIFSDASNGVSLTGTTYGLGINADSHMMKNSEWGAAAYLSHSQYGINTEIRINNNSSFTTGCGASEVNSAGSTSCQIAYAGVSSGSYPQSTTGNISGIFDISGGAWEYVMGAHSDLNGKPRSGNDATLNSGFNGLLLDGTTYSSGISLPQKKYYDVYLNSQFTGTYSTNMALCTIDSCGGHALNETKGWHGDYPYFVDSGSPWFSRGGYNGDGELAGAYFENYYAGHAGSYGSFRSVIITLPKYTVSYNANGGSGAPSNQTKVYGVDMTVSSTEPTKANVVFQGWGTSSDSKKVVYSAGDVYTNNSDQTLYAVWKESVAPIATISLTNNIAASQTATLVCTDEVGVTGYYWGTNQTPSDNDYLSISSTTNMNRTETVSDSGTYYLYCRDNDGNISESVSIETYKTTLIYTDTDGEHTEYVITEKDKSFTYSPTLNKYTFLGWYTSSDKTGTKITTYTPSGNTTLYGKTIENTLTGDMTLSGTVTYGGTLTANPNITAAANTQNAGEAASYTYQWYTNTTNSTSGGTAISGATSKTYTIGTGLIDKYIYVVVTATMNNYVSKTVSAVTSTAVTKRSVTITASDQTVTYGTAITQGTSKITASGLASGDSVTAITLTQSTTNATTTGTITPSVATIKKGSTDVTSNYNITYVDGKLTVNKATLSSSQITVTEVNTTYDGVTYYAKLKSTIAGLKVESGSSTSYGTTIIESTVANTTYNLSPHRYAAGETIVYYKVSDPDGNYNDYTGSAKIVVAKRPITITAGSMSKTYDGTPLTDSSCSGDNLVTNYGHTLTCTMTSSSTITDAGSVNNVISSVKIKNSSGDDRTSNYDITYVSGTLSISKITLTPSVTASNKTYNGNTTASCTVSLTGIVSGDTVTASATGTFADKNVGTGKTVTCSSITLAGTSAGNYTLSKTSATTTANITGKSLTPSVTASNKTYDGGTTASCTVSLTGIVSGDTVTASATGTFADKNVGTGKTVTCSSITLAGTSAGNYTLSKTSATTTANITAKSLTPSVTASNKAYNGNATASCTISLSGIISGDTVTGAAGSCTFADANAGTGKTVTASSITISGTSVGNYTLSKTSATTTANITQINNTCSVTAVGGTYTGTALALVKASNCQGTVYYSTSTALTSSNYSTSGSSTIPTGAPGSSENSKTFTVYWYTPGNTNYKAASGTVSNITVSRQTYTVSYNACSGTGAPSAQTKYYGRTLTLSSTTPTRTGYTFKGWSTAASCSAATSATHSAGGSYTTNAGDTLYAVWQANTYTVTYKGNGGLWSGTDTWSNTATYDASYTVEPNFYTRSGYTFAGWTTNSDGSDDGYGWTGWSGTWNYLNGQYGISNGNLVLYARWVGNTPVYAVVDGQDSTTNKDETPSYSTAITYAGNGNTSGTNYYYTYILKFTTPAFSFTSSSITINLSMKANNSSYTNISLRYALLSSDANYTSYQKTTAAVTDANQIYTNTYTNSNLSASSYVNVPFTISTTKISPSKAYYLVLWTTHNNGGNVVKVNSTDNHSVVIS